MDKAPYGEGDGIPCGVCREFFMQLNEKNEDMEIMTDFKKRETVILKEITPFWWGKECYKNAKKDS